MYISNYFVLQNLNQKLWHRGEVKLMLQVENPYFVYTYKYKHSLFDETFTLLASCHLALSWARCCLWHLMEDMTNIFPVGLLSISSMTYDPPPPPLYPLYMYYLHFTGTSNVSILYEWRIRGWDRNRLFLTTPPPPPPPLSFFFILLKSCSWI